VSEALTQIELIVQRIACVRRVDPDSSPYHDFGISGDDAFEMLEDIAERFNISFTGFQFDRYFCQEDEALGEHLMKLLGRAPKRERLTLRHLSYVAERGTWFNPEPTSD
jgi:hypothetical protein